jgi:hypothetical protein
VIKRLAPLNIDALPQDPREGAKATSVVCTLEWLDMHRH